ncbi:MAG: hypothetical protein ACREOE_05310, partial [Gemmatimonadales bacterium]
MSIVTGPAASSAARSAGSKLTIRAVAAASPASAQKQGGILKIHTLYNTGAALSRRHRPTVDRAEPG